MLLLAIWLCAVLFALGGYFTARQVKRTKLLSQKLIAAEQRTEQLAGYVQRALEDVYVIGVLMAERGHLEPDEIERGRERLLKGAKSRENPQAAKQQEARPRGTVH